MRLRVKMNSILWPARDRYAYPISEFNEYEGEVVPNPPWLNDDHFCLTMEGLYDEPGAYRILEKSRIVHGWLMPVRAGDTPRREAVITAANGKRYTVSLNHDGTGFRCNCTSYGYRRTCSHIKEVMDAA